MLPGATAIAAMRHLDENGAAVDGVEEIRVWLQKMMDTAMDELTGTHFDIPAPVRTVEAMIAPVGSAAAPYYTFPSLDFSRPGRTWLPTLGASRLPLWNLVSTWYHEGVPGHHLQLAQWTYLADRLSTFQTTVGAVSANMEGWALYRPRPGLRPQGLARRRTVARQPRPGRPDRRAHPTLTIPGGVGRARSIPGQAGCADRSGPARSSG